MFVLNYINGFARSPGALMEDETLRWYADKVNERVSCMQQNLGCGDPEKLNSDPYFHNLIKIESF